MTAPGNITIKFENFLPLPVLVLVTLGIEPRFNSFSIRTQWYICLYLAFDLGWRCWITGETVKRKEAKTGKASEETE